MKKVLIQFHAFYVDYRSKVSRSDVVALTYYMVVSLFPIASLLVFIASFLNIDLTVVEELLMKYMTPEYTKVILDAIVVRQFTWSNVVPLGVSIYVVSRGIYQLYDVSLDLYPVQKQEHLIVGRLLSLVKTIVVLVLMVINVAIFTAAPIIVSYLRLNWLFHYEYLYVLLINFVVIAILYEVIPKVKLRVIDTMKGALCATLLLALLILILGIYFSVADYTNVYGPLSSLVMILVSLSWMCEIVYLGLYIAVNSYKKRTSG